MSHRIERSEQHTKSVDALHAAFTSEQYWNDRLAEIGGPGAKILDVRTHDETFTVDLQQAIAAKYLPQLVTKVHPGDLILKRTETWGPVAASTASGHFEVSVDGAPATINGTLALAADRDGSVLRIAGQVDVRIPLFGGRIEEAVVEQLQRLLVKESEFTERWTSAKG